MISSLIIFVLAVIVLWIVAINIIRRELEITSAMTEMPVQHIDVVLEGYDKKLFGGVIIGVTSWGELCSVNDFNFTYETFVNRNIGTNVRIYYVTMYKGIMFFRLSNNVTSIVINQNKRNP